MTRIAARRCSLLTRPMSKTAAETSTCALERLGCCPWYHYHDVVVEHDSGMSLAIHKTSGGSNQLRQVIEEVTTSL